MRNVIIGFSSPNTWKIGAEAIKWWIDAPYSHCYIRYVDDQNRDIVFEAAHGNVHPILYTNFVTHTVIIKEVSLEFTDEEYQRLRDFYYNEMGEPYAYMDLFIVFAYDICKKFGIKVQDGNIPGYICSQLAATMLAEIKGYKFDKPLNLIKPDDLFKALE